jgi:cytoskeletal protein RodZ
MAQNNKPKKNPAGVLVALLMLLLAAVAIFIVLRSFAAGEPEPTSAPSPAESSEPTAAETEAPSPSPTAEPSPSPTPEEEPSPSPTPYPVIEESGSFKSDTGTALNIVADWTAVSSGDGNVTLTVTLSAESYSIECGAIRNGATIVIDGESHTFSTSALDYDGNTSAKNVLGSVSTTLQLGDGGTLTVPISAVWAFGGTYSDKEMGSISAEGEAAIG